MRKTAIIAALSLLLTLVCPVWIFQPVQGNTPAFSGSLNTVAGGAGDRVTLTVHYDGSLDSIGAFLTRVDYDASCFEYVRTEASAVLGMGYVVTRPGDGTVGSAYTMANSRTSLTDAGETFTYVFRVREDAPSVEASFYLRVYDAVDPAARPINTELRQELSFAVEAPPSADASLLMLYSEEGDLSPDFSPDQHAYTMTVPYATTSVTFYAEAVEGATFRVNRKNLGPGGSDTEFIITVTAEDGKTKQEYTVTVHREAKATPPPSSTDASLSMLYSEEGELSPDFSPEQNEYTMTVPYEVTRVTFYAEMAEGATYRVNRKNLGPGGSDTEFIITVTAEDGKTKQEYTVTVHREAKATPVPSSTDASLSMLYSEEGELTPDFSPDQHAYNMTVPYATTSITFYAEAAEGATYRVNRKNLGPGGSNTEFIITVTAEDGKTKQEYTVTVHREAKAPTPTPDPLKADASLLTLYSEEGELTPAFSPELHEYKMTVPYAVTSVTFYAEAAEGATYRVNRKNLGPGGSDTEFIITVTAEDGKTKQEYTVTVHREAKAPTPTPDPLKADASLLTLYSEEGELTPAFSPDQHEYTMTVPYETTTVSFSAETAEGATYRVNRKNLGPGGSDTEFIITVTAEDGKTKQEYTVTVHREAKATPVPSSTDASLSMLYSEEGELTPAFSPEQHEYTMTVPYATTSVTFYAEAAEGATYRVNRKNLGPGGSDTEFIITVTAEDGKTKQEYTVTVHREAKAPTPIPDPLKADASLITLYSEEGELTPAFSPEQLEYTMTVPYATTSVTFYAEAAEGATFRVNRKNLGPGGSNTEFIITVTAEDGKTKQEYTITVHREAKAPTPTPDPLKADASLLTLYSEEGELTPDFSPEQLEYKMTVPYEITSVTFYAEAAEGATYRVNRKNLGPGGSNTEFIITVTAEDGKTKQEYTVTVHREAKAPTPTPDPLKTDASLITLYSEEGELTPDFSPDQHDYAMTVPYEITSVTFYAEAAEGATYRVNRKNLGPGGSNTEFIITVTAEDGKTKQEYTVTVHREAKAPTPTPDPLKTDASLITLYSEEGELTPAFSPEQLEYTMTVPYATTSVTFYAEAAEGATYRVNRKNLGPGGSDTEFIITVTAEDGKTKQEYKVTVHRETKATPPPSSSDASLSMLYSEEGDLSPDFSPDQHEYTMTVPYEVTSVTFYAEAEEGATYRVNRKNLGPDGSDTEFIITVTAEDGKTKQEYTVTVHREAKATPMPSSTDASLITLYSEEGELNPAFSPDQHEYTMTVPYEITSVTFYAEAAEGATYRVNRKNLGPGGSDTEFVIIVTAEDGKTKQEYKVTVHREEKAPTPTPDPLKADASLLTLYSEEGELTPDFSPEQLEYTMTVPYETTTVTFYAEAAEGATFRVNRKNLGPGGSDTEFIITVTAEDGKTKQEYTVTVHREAKAPTPTPDPLKADASLITLYSEEGELTPDFSPDQHEYTMTVPYETTTVSFSAETTEGATYRVNRKNLGPGGSDTEFIITVTAEDGKTKQEYTVTVHREAKATPVPSSTDASLAMLYSEEGELTPDFSPEQLEYKMTVPYSVTSVTFYAEAAEGATYRMNRKNLGPGGSDTEFIITVTAEDGKTKQEYTVTVHREAKAPTPTPDPLKADASLITLYSEEGELTPVFSPEQLEYTMTVPYETTTVSFSAETAEGATYRVNRKNLGPGGSESNFEITVTAADGQTKQTYTVLVHREAKAATPKPALTPKPTATAKSTATPKPAATAKSTAGGSTKTAAPQSTPAAGKIVVPDSSTQSPTTTATPTPTATAPPVSAATEAPANTADASPQPIVLRAGNSASAAPVVVGILMLGGSILVAGPLAGKLPGIGRKNPKDP